MQTIANDIESLVEGCCANNRSAQQALYRHLYEFAMTIALRYSRDEQDAADIVTNAFIKIFKSIQSFDRSKGNLHGWVKRIVVNEGLDHVKSRRRFSENVELETVPEPPVDNQVLQQMGAEELMNLVKRLPPATHAVFVLYAVEGYNHREIAQQLHISEGTSKWHLAEARKSLQKQIVELNKN